MSNDHEIRRNAIVTSATEQMRALLETHFRDITSAAEESFVGDERQTEPVAKVGVSVQFGAIAAATKVSVKCSWSVKHADESEEEIDPLQSKLGLEPLGKLKKTLRDAGATMTIESGGKEVEIK
jgi:hypothetical protein